MWLVSLHKRGYGVNFLTFLKSKPWEMVTMKVHYKATLQPQIMQVLSQKNLEMVSIQLSYRCKVFVLYVYQHIFLTFSKENLKKSFPNIIKFANILTDIMNKNRIFNETDVKNTISITKKK